MAYNLRTHPCKDIGGRRGSSLRSSTVVDAAGPDSFIEGNVLVYLCEQRSGQRGSGCDAPAEANELPVPLLSGCDAPAEAEELPVPLASPPRPPTLPAVQVRQYSWHYYAKNETGSRSPCVRPRSDPSKMKSCNMVRSRLIILINEEINKANWMVSNSAKLDRLDQAAHLIWSLCE